MENLNLPVNSGKVNWPSVIRNFRMSKRLKQAALAADLGVTQAMISRWENGESDPPERVKRRMMELVQDAFVVAPAPTWIDLVSMNPSIEFVTDSLGMFKAVSLGALDLFGLEREAIEGRQVSQFLGGDFIDNLDLVREKGMFQNNLAFAQSMGSLEINVPSGLKTVHADFIHWPRISDARTVYCVHSGAAIDEGKFTSRLASRGGEKFIARKTF